MRMRISIVLPVLAAWLAFGLFAFIATAQDKPAPGDKPGMPSAAEMEAMMKAAQPGEEHARLMKMAGDWDADVKFFAPDGTPGGGSKGVMHMEPILEGRYLQMKYDGSMDMGAGPTPFKGMGVVGYDNVAKKYNSIWMDSMSTSMMITEGTRSGDVVTCTGKVSDPMTGKASEVKEISTHVDDNTHKYELWMTGPTGQLMKVLEITYTRKK